MATIAERLEHVIKEILERPELERNQDAQDADLMRNLEAKGAVHVILTRNIGKRAFTDIDSDNTFSTWSQDNYEQFQRLRGTKGFARALRDLPDKLSNCANMD